MTPATHSTLVRSVQAWPRDRRVRAHALLLERAPLFDIELVSACNIRCAFCPRADLMRRARFMSDEVFDAALRFLPDEAVVMLAGMGEPTLHPRLSTWVTRLTERGISTCLVTNGVRLVPQLQMALSRAGIAQIQISVHGLTRAAVARVVDRESHLEQVLANLRHLGRRRLPGTRVRLNFVETADNGEEREAVRAFALAHGFDFFWRRQHSRSGLVGAHRPAHAGCGIFAAVTFISSDGDILPCVNDVGAGHAIGSVGALRWTDIAAWKRRTIARDEWFSACASCDDDYRWVLLGQGQLDEPAQTPAHTSVAATGP